MKRQRCANEKRGDSVAQMFLVLNQGEDPRQHQQAAENRQESRRPATVCPLRFQEVFFGQCVLNPHHSLTP